MTTIPNATQTLQIYNLAMYIAYGATKVKGSKWERRTWQADAPTASKREEERMVMVEKESRILGNSGAGKMVAPAAPAYCCTSCTRLHCLLKKKRKEKHHLLTREEEERKKKKKKKKKRRRKKEKIFKLYFR